MQQTFTQIKAVLRRTIRVLPRFAATNVRYDHGIIRYDCVACYKLQELRDSHARCQLCAGRWTTFGTVSMQRISREHAGGRSAVNFLEAKHHWPLVCTTLYRLVTEAYVYVNNLLRVDTWQQNGKQSNPQLFDCKSDVLSITPPSHTRGLPQGTVE